MKNSIYSLLALLGVLIVGPLLGQTTPPTKAWTHTIPKPSTSTHSSTRITSVAATPDGGMLVAGYRRDLSPYPSIVGETDVLFYAKISATGSLVQEVLVNTENQAFFASSGQIIPLTNGRYALLFSWRSQVCAPSPCSNITYVRQIIVDGNMNIKNTYNIQATTNPNYNNNYTSPPRYQSNNRMPDGFHQLFRPNSSEFKLARFNNAAQRSTDLNLLFEDRVPIFVTRHKDKLYVLYDNFSAEGEYFLEMSLDGTNQVKKIDYTILNSCKSVQFMQDDSRIFSSVADNILKTDANYNILWTGSTTSGRSVHITVDDNIITTHGKVYNKDGTHLYDLTETSIASASDNVYGELFIANNNANGSASIIKYNNASGITKVTYVDHAAGDASELIKADIQTRGHITFGTSDDPIQVKDSTTVKWQDGGRVGWRLTFDGANATLSFHETDVPNPSSQVLRLTKSVIATKANQIEIKASINGSGGVVPAGTKAVIRLYTINGKRVIGEACEAAVIGDGTSNIWSKVYMNSAELSKVPFTLTGTFEVDAPGENANINHGDRIRFQIETNYDPAQEGSHPLKTNY